VSNCCCSTAAGGQLAPPLSKGVRVRAACDWEELDKCLFALNPPQAAIAAAKRK